MPTLPAYVKTGTVLGKSYIVGTDTAGDVDSDPDAIYPVGADLLFTPSLPRNQRNLSFGDDVVYLQDWTSTISSTGDPVTVDGGPLKLVANIGQTDNDQVWYWVCKVKINGVWQKEFRFDVTADTDNYIGHQQPVPAASPSSAVVRGADGAGAPPSGTPDDYVAVSVGSSTTWMAPADARAALGLDSIYGPGGSAGNIGTAQADVRYVPVFGVQPTGTTAGDTAAITAAINAAITQGSGIVYINKGVYTVSASMPAYDPRYITVMGAGRNITIIRPTSALTGDLFRAQGAVFGVDQATYFGDMTIDGVNAGDGACGLHWGDVNGGKIDRLDIRNFADTTALTTPVGVDPTTLSKGLWIDNTRDTLGITERLELGDVRLYANSVNVLMTVKAGMVAANQSFYYQRWKHVQISTAAGQVGVWMKNCLMQGAELNIMANLSADSTHPGVFLYLDGSGADHAARILDAALAIHIETSGAGGTTTYGLLADSGTTISGQGVFSAYAGTGMTNQSAGIVSLMGRIKMPGIHDSTPVNGWNIVSQAADYTAEPWDHVRCTAAMTVTLPASPNIGQKVAVSREGTVTVTINPNSGQTINSLGTGVVKMAASSVVVQSAIVLVAMSTTSWRVESAANTDAALGLFVGGPLNAQGGTSVNVSAFTTANTFNNTHTMVTCGSSGVTHTFGVLLRAGQLLWITNITGGAVTLAATGSGTVNGVSSVTLPAGATVTALVSTAGSNPVVNTSTISAGSSGATTADPLGWGICTNVGPVVVGPVARTLVANQANFYRLVGGGVAITKCRVHVGTSSGNIGVAYYSNTGTGLSAAPGALLASSGSVACPAAGVADIALGSTITPNVGDWVCVWSDNATATLLGPSASGFISTLFSGRAYRQSSVSGGPPTTVGPLSAGQSIVVETVGVP